MANNFGLIWFEKSQTADGKCSQAEDGQTGAGLMPAQTNLQSNVTSSLLFISYT